MAVFGWKTEAQYDIFWIKRLSRKIIIQVEVYLYFTFWELKPKQIVGFIKVFFHFFLIVRKIF